MFKVENVLNKTKVFANCQEIDYVIVFGNIKKENKGKKG
jgi:hypothetical protein